MQWEKTTQQKYELMISKIPLFHREITKQVVPLKAEENAKARGADRKSTRLNSSHRT